MKIETIKQHIAEIDSLNTPTAVAEACRSALEEIVDYVFGTSGIEKPEKASLLELIDNDIVSDYFGDGDAIALMTYIRILGMLAQHGEKIKKSDAKLSLANIKSICEIIESKTNGNAAIQMPYMSELKTRKLYVDLYLKEADWEILETKNTILPSMAGIEIEVSGMPNAQGKGFCDYVLYGRDGKPLAVVEVKKTSEDPEKGRHQVELYGECLRKEYGYTPVLYYTNGYSIKVLDGIYPPRALTAFHTLDELELMLQRRNRGDITDITINKNITDRPYQTIAITSICDLLNAKHRRGLLVMATGTGKTRTAISIVDVLSRNKWVKTVLFLADRTALVNQAKKNFEKLLPNMSVCELSGSDDKDYNARLMFCTYQTMINYIDAEDKRFKSGRFDLIIIDEAHRSIFNKYASIFKYYDAFLIGLTATPKNEVDSNTYKIFGCEPGVPNFDYPLETAVKEKFLVYYKNLNRTTELISKGIRYDDLSPEEQKQLDDYLVAQDLLNPGVIDGTKLFKVLYNRDTCRVVIEDLMTKGIRTDGGERIGKTIIFAYNHKHAQQIVDTFNEMYPEYGADYCQLIDNYITYADDLVIKFEENPNFRIAVSVDMLDTGVDIPEVLNLVFFKQVRSKIKFIQMIGRGTRLCADIFGPGKDKTHFLIIDYCDNFRFFSMEPNGSEVSTTMPISQRMYVVLLDLLYELQKIQYQEQEYTRKLYESIKKDLYQKIVMIKSHSVRISVREEMKYVDKYINLEVWRSLSAVEVKEIKTHLVHLIDSGLNGGELAVAFDLRMYNVMLSYAAEGDIAKASGHIKSVRKTAQYLLNEKASIPQVLNKATQLKLLNDETFWKNVSIQSLEDSRKSVRDLMQFIDRRKNDQYDIDIADVSLPSDFVGGSSIDIRSYREKVIDYLAENIDSPVIKKIQHLEKINTDDINELERILWQELGSKQDYDNTTSVNNLAVFVRSLIGVDQETINNKFGEYLSGNKFNSQQQEFVKTIIDYVRQNGDIERSDLVNKEPFDDINISQLFEDKVKDVTAIVDSFHDVVIA